MNEIGSEFCTAELKKDEARLFLSGRTALEFILRDILAQAKIRTALLPSYCCHTMIEPFRRHGITVRFYDVFYDGKGLAIELPNAQEGEILLAVKYFGFFQLRGFHAKEVRQSWQWIIEDRTHSWLSGDKTVCADYDFTSYRKWTGVSGIALARKHTGGFVIPLKPRYNEAFLELRRQAQKCKARYLEENVGDKAAYLEMFARAEALLEDDYVDYVPAAEDIHVLMNLDAELVRMQRMRNAKILTQELQDISGLRIMNPEIGGGDALLCVPVLVEAKKRDALRKRLIEEGIYCPVHWPLSKLHTGISVRGMELYSCELSLICDQRYGPEDMVREYKVIRDFFEGNN